MSYSKTRPGLKRLRTSLFAFKTSAGTIFSESNAE